MVRESMLDDAIDAPAASPQEHMVAVLGAISHFESDSEAAVSSIRSAVNHAEGNAGVTGFGAPIYGAAGELIGALALAAPSSRARRRTAELTALAKEAAAAISSHMGYQPAG